MKRSIRSRIVLEPHEADGHHLPAGHDLVAVRVNDARVDKLPLFDDGSGEIVLGVRFAVDVCGSALDEVLALHASLRITWGQDEPLRDAALAYDYFTNRPELE